LGVRKKKKEDGTEGGVKKEKGRKGNIALVTLNGSGRLFRKRVPKWGGLQKQRAKLESKKGRFYRRNGGKSWPRGLKKKKTKGAGKDGGGARKSWSG